MVDANRELALATTVLLRAALERGNDRDALRYADRIQQLITKGEVVDLEFNPGRKLDEATVLLTTA